MIPYGRQDITQDDVDAVVDVLTSDFLTQGPIVPKFEAAVASYTGASHALAVNSATSALHVACLALGLGRGDWLWTTPNTFVASANCAQYCQANVDFVDIDPVTYNMSASRLAQKLELAEMANRLPKIVVPVHFSGQSCDMKAIHELSKRYGFRIIEDASHAIGGRYQGEPIGRCQFSDITVFSFHPVKIITTAEGGMALTNDSDLAQKINLYRSHGVTRDPALMTDPWDAPWFYQQVVLGYNYRMTDLQAALGLSQMDRLDFYVKSRNKIAERYDALLADSAWIIPSQAVDRVSARHLYVVRLPECLASYRKQVFDFLRSKGIGVNVHYIPVHTQPHYRNKGVDYGNLHTSERYYESAISIPLHPQLKVSEQRFIVDTLNKALNDIITDDRQS